jgi:hypothetical protein
LSIGQSDRSTKFQAHYDFVCRADKRTVVSTVERSIDTADWCTIFATDFFAVRCSDVASQFYADHGTDHTAF